MMHSSFFIQSRKGGVQGMVLGLTGVAVLLAIIFFLARGKSAGATGITFFYGDTCPHCANVEKFFQENNVEAKVKFEKKEVYNNKANQRALAERAKTCGIPTDSIGVPFLWTGSGCLVGETDIESFFRQKL